MFFQGGDQLDLHCLHWQFVWKAMPATALSSADTDSCRRQGSQSFSPNKREADSLQSKAKATEHTALMLLQLMHCPSLIPAISSATYFLSSLTEVICSPRESVPHWHSGEDSELPCSSFVWLLKLAPAFHRGARRGALSNKQNPAGAETFPTTARPRLHERRLPWQARGAHPHVPSKWCSRVHVNNKVNPEPESEKMSSINQGKRFIKSIHLC